MSIFIGGASVSNEGEDSSGAPYPGWCRYPGDDITVYAPQASHAARCASTILREAEQIHAALCELLKPDLEMRHVPVAIYVTDSDASHGKPGGDPLDPSLSLPARAQEADAKIVLFVNVYAVADE